MVPSTNVITFRGNIMCLTITLMLAFSSVMNAADVTYSFTVTPTSGPLVGSPQSGIFTFDSSIIPVGGTGVLNQTGLFTNFNLTWNGITYNSTTVNTGALTFNNSIVTDVLFGTSCGDGGCGLIGREEGFTVIGSTFRYVIVNDPTFYRGIATISSGPIAVPEPSTYAILAGTLAVGVVAARKRCKVSV